MRPYLRLNVPTPPASRGAGSADIVRAVEDTVARREVLHGLRLPPVRALAHQLGISKNTVHVAYEELVARGVLVNRPRSGYFLAEDRDRGFESPLHAAGRPPLQEAVMTRRTGPPRDEIDLGSVFVDPALLPRKRIAECVRSVLRVPGIETFYDPQGYPPLRRAIASRLRKRGIPARAEHVLCTNGSQQALDVLCRALSRRVVATENPAYGIGKRLFEMSGIETVGLDLDPFGGIDLEGWTRTLERSRPGLLYLTTNFQNPTGYSYTTGEIAAFLELSARLGFGILEDDWGSDMLSYSRYRPPVRALGGENVLYINSFTKKLLPSLRLGYMVTDPAGLPALLEAKRVATLGNPTLMEAALAEFLDRGYYETHLDRLHRALDHRYHRALAKLGATMPPDVRWTRPGGGPVLWLELPERIPEPELTARLHRRGVRVEPCHGSFFGKPRLKGYRLGYAFLEPETFARGVEILAGEMERW